LPYALFTITVQRKSRSFRYSYSERFAEAVPGNHFNSY